MAVGYRSRLTGKFEPLGASPAQVSARGPVNRRGRFSRTPPSEPRDQHLIGAHVRPELKETIERLAADEGISVSHYVGRIVREELERLRNGARAPASDPSPGPQAQPRAGAPRNLYDKIRGRREPERVPWRKKGFFEKWW